MTGYLAQVLAHVKEKQIDELAEPRPSVMFSASVRSGPARILRRILVLFLRVPSGRVSTAEMPWPN